MDDSLGQSAGRNAPSTAIVPTAFAMTPEHASRLAVTAVAADLEYWARSASVDGYVGVDVSEEALGGSQC